MAGQHVIPYVLYQAIGSHLVAYVIHSCLIDRDSSSWGNSPDVRNSREEMNISSTGTFP